MKTLREKTNQFLRNIQEKEGFKQLIPSFDKKQPLFMNQNNFIRHIVLKQDGQNMKLVNLQQQLFKECVEPTALLIQTIGLENYKAFCLQQCVENIVDKYFRGVSFISEINMQP